MLFALPTSLALAVEPTTPAPAAPAPAPSGPVTYTLDAAKSWLYVVAYYDPDRWTPVTAHDHGIKATSFDGKVTWDPANVGACNVSISFPVSVLAVDPPGMREREGLPLDGAIDESTKKTVVNNMDSKSNLDASSFPTISYQSSGCVANGTKVDVTGTLSIRGVGKAVTVPMTITATATSFSARGTFMLNHSDFGMSPFTYGPGTPKNLEKLKFVVDVVGAPK